MRIGKRQVRKALKGVPIEDLEAFRETMERLHECEAEVYEKMMDMVDAKMFPKSALARNDVYPNAEMVSLVADDILCKLLGPRRVSGARDRVPLEQRPVPETSSDPVRVSPVLGGHGDDYAGAGDVDVDRAREDLERLAEAEGAAAESGEPSAGGFLGLQIQEL